MTIYLQTDEDNDVEANFKAWSWTDCWEWTESAECKTQSVALCTDALLPDDVKHCSQFSCDTHTLSLSLFHSKE